MARSIVRIADELGLRTVAEGIEHDEQLAALRHLGCTLGQGYLFAAPMSPDAISAQLSGPCEPAVIPPLLEETPALMTVARVESPATDLIGPPTTTSDSVHVALIGPDGPISAT